MRASHHHRRRGFTLVEAVVATAITAMAGSALLLGVSSSLQTSQDIVDQAIAVGMAQQLLDEIAGKLWCDPGTDPHQTTLGPSSQSAGCSRQGFTSLADYNGYACQPPQDEYGIPLGTDNGSGGERSAALQCNSSFFANWQQSVTVYYVSATDFTTPLTNNQTSDYRAVEVRIYLADPTYGQVQLALARRVFAYVPIL